MADSSFFDESREQSLVKATIVAKYFWAWAKVIMPTAKKHSGRIGYIDLFAGPGRYKDGAQSTPLMILEKAVEDTDMRQMLVAIFNDKDDENSRSLEAAIRQLPGIDKLVHAPKVHNEDVGDRIVKMFEQMNLIPTLFFVDPWGYKGLSLKLVNAVLKDWGCDCVFFFNYNRINMGLGNEVVEEHMNALFGAERAAELRTKLEPLSPDQRELAVVEELCQALLAMETRVGSVKYVLPFRFRTAVGNRTSHHLVFVSKHPLGYKIMKGIMAQYSSTAAQGVPSFEYSPADARQPLLFELNRPLDDLETMLLDEFAGRTLTMQEVYDRHNLGRPYVEKNYKEMLTQMELAGKIMADPPASKRRKGTFAPTTKVTFPAKGG